jgi:glycosyltransferase involved in cell wall biosynthesis
MFDTPLVALPRVPLPFSRAIIERVWWATGMPKAERYVPDADWVYSSADAYVPTRKALFASTIHDIEVFEDDLPWSRRPGWKTARRNWRMRLDRIFRHARLVVTVSEFSKRRMVELLGADPQRIVVVGNGVEPCFADSGPGSAADTQAREWQHQHDRYLVTVGGLSVRKGAPYLFDLADELRKRGSDLRVLVSGRTDAEYAARLAATPNVESLGFVNDEKLPGLLRGSIALVFLSRYEGFGIPILEAMASGTPAFVSNFASLPEVAGGAGIVVDVTRPAEVAATVAALSDDAQRRNELIERGYERARAFSWDACVTRLLTAMEQAQSE